DAGSGPPGALGEHRAGGPPVVATDSEGTPERVIHGETVCLVAPRDAAALAEAVVGLASDPERARRMGRAGRARVEAMFSTRVKVERTEALYHRLLAHA